MNQIRPATVEDADAIGRIHVRSWQESYRGIVPDVVLDPMARGDRGPMWRRRLTEFADRNFVYVAEDPAGEVVGFASGGPEREQSLGYDGELYALYLLRRSQKAGVGRGLVAAVARRLAAEGYGSMLVWVLADNPTRHFYAHLGGIVVAEKMINIGGAELAEVAYGWPTLPGLPA